MKKSQLIAALAAIEGDLLVILDCDGRFSTDYKPDVRIVDKVVFENINAIDADVNPKPALGEAIILL